MTSTAEQSSRIRSLAGTLVLAGVLLASFGTPLAMLPGGYSPFGPVKALVLLSATALSALGLALHPTLTRDALRAALTSRAALAALALVALSIAATALSPDPVRSALGRYPEYRGLALLLCSAITGFAALALARFVGDFGRTLSRTACVALLLMSGYGLAQAAGLDPVGSSTEFVVRLVRSTMGNSSGLGVVLVMALPLALLAALQERGGWHWIARTAVVLGAITLAWTLSRGAWLGAIVAAAAWLVVASGTRSAAWRRRAWPLLTVGIVLALALTALLVPYASSRMAATARTNEGTAGWRLHVWSRTTQLIAERPLLGYGPAAFEIVFPPRRTAEMVGGDGPSQILDDPHNLVLSAMFAGGALAGVALLWLLAEVLLSLAPGRFAHDAPAPPLSPALAAAIAGGFTALLFHFVTLDSAPLLGALLGLAVGTPPRPAHSVTPVVDRAAAARIVSAAVALLTVTAAVSAFGVLRADRVIAQGYQRIAVGAPWSESSAAFESAARIAQWEPAMHWAFLRGASQQASARRDPAAAEIIPQLAEEALRRIHDHPLLVAQAAEGYLVSSQITGDTTTREKALGLAERAVALDPANGYRLGALGAVKASAGDMDGARIAYEKAVNLAPEDLQAWQGLARVYRASGLEQLAQKADTKASELESR